MKLPLHGIPEEGLRVNFNHETKELKQSLEQYFPSSTYEGEIELRPAGEHFHLKGHFNSDLKLTCSFCNEPFDYVIDEDFQEILAPVWEKNLKTASNPKEMFESDVELITGLEGEDFYLSEYLKEVVEFALPAHPKCREDCKGLCLTCGSNLNETTCECSKTRQSTSMAFSGLKDLKIDKKH
ncbi:MAG: DUF177 domain-containing protein [Bdellovibrionales bacterium]|nr:DUF177 domain-containing protein [Bdellovibrionales bacterium]